jgi:hypothetical protein
VNTGELVHAWLMNIEALRPKPSDTREIILKMNQPQTEILQYQNKLTHSAVFEFQSSRPKTMIPAEEVISIEARNTKNVKLQFFPRKRYGQEEVFLFVNDLD